MRRLSWMLLQEPRTPEVTKLAYSLAEQEGISKEELDRYGREIPDDEYQSKDFERVIALRARTEAIARDLTEFMKNTDGLARTIDFCVDQKHASELIPLQV